MTDFDAVVAEMADWKGVSVATMEKTLAASMLIAMGLLTVEGKRPVALT